MKLAPELQSVEEMYWTRDGNGGFIDLERTPLAPTVPLASPPQIFGDMGYNIHLEPDLDMDAARFLEEVGDDSVLGSLIATTTEESVSGNDDTTKVTQRKDVSILSCKHEQKKDVSGHKDNDSDDFSDCATVITRNCDSLSSIHSWIVDPPWLDLDYMPYDEHKEKGFEMEDILQVNSANTVQHSGIQCDPGANANIGNGKNGKIQSM